ncbi:MAG: SAM-dependent methyltransferase, partial [Candidatus Saccharimonadales bacterium]
MKQRLDVHITRLGMVPTRSQAESVIRLGEVRVNGQVVTKPGHFVGESDRVVLASKERYVSRAGLKLASVAEKLNVRFDNATVLDVGSSTGGFTDYALRHGAKKVFAVDVGTDQLHPSLRQDTRIELHEKTDIRDFQPPVSPDIV